MFEQTYNNKPIQTNIYVFMYVYIFIYAYACVYLCLSKHTKTNLYKRICMYLCTYDMHVHMYI
jgi:hypothetical protein